MNSAFKMTELINEFMAPEISILKFNKIPMVFEKKSKFKISSTTFNEENERRDDIYLQNMSHIIMAHIK